MSITLTYMKSLGGGIINSIDSKRDRRIEVVMIIREHGIVEERDFIIKFSSLRPLCQMLGTNNHQASRIVALRLKQYRSQLFSAPNYFREQKTGSPCVW